MTSIDPSSPDPSAVRTANRLSGEKSPYLLQHAHNPVDWYPWSEEAFERASREDRPVFLSIGYSTCHWCHVMAHESFEDLEVARLLNRAFVCVKVDREERPDIDGVYMAVCQAMTGRGGWPLTIIMTPDRKPFFAATYIPRQGRFGTAGLLQILPRIEAQWKESRPELLDSADRIVSQLSSRSLPPGKPLDRSTLDGAYQGLLARFDWALGGFGGAPKFPSPHNLTFLLRYWKRSGEAAALEMAETTLQAMRMGGIFDHLGYGFHRYSTDARWKLPHFEKMLYDQALLTIAYLEAFQATGKEEYARTAREILEYVHRDMTSPEGAFYSAEDADSEGVEGKFYLWTEDQMRSVLGPGADLAVRAFSVQRGGNFAGESTGQRSGANVLFLQASLPDLAATLGQEPVDLQRRLEVARARLLAAREARVRPRRDEKILTDWNGLMIAALARAAQVLGDGAYLQGAQLAADFLIKEVRSSTGLMHRFLGGAGMQGNLDDYAFLIWGLIELYEAGFDPRYLAAALDLAEEMVEHFWDRKDGGFYFSPLHGEELILRPKEVYDGALPSGNAVAMMDLLRLGRITGRTELEERASRLAEAFSGQVDRTPMAYCHLLSALDFAMGPTCEVAIAGEPRSGDTLALVRSLGRHFIPRKVQLLVPSGQAGAEIRRLAPWTRDLVPRGGATAYVCSGYSCQLPTGDAAKMLQLLGQDEGTPVS
ncbi:MAG: thioredoxin domain-containing protein [Methanosarcinales archaeon]|nr:thioredoxin domain-containing protein [Methanosarcinales archaeon]